MSAKTVAISGFLLLNVLMVGVGIARGMVRNTPHAEAAVLGEAKPVGEAMSLAIETVGANDSADGKSLGTSWPGEIVSLGDLDVQPVREGTIVEWFVGVGQKVRRGQAIARLSAPPAGPDITQMIAEQAKMVTEARTEAVAMANYAEKNKKQLLALRASLDTNKTQVGNILSTDLTSDRSQVSGFTMSAVTKARETAAIKQKKIRAVIEQSLASEFPEIASYPKDPISSYRVSGYFSTVFNQTIGVLDSVARANFISATMKLLSELKDPAAIPEDTVTAYFQAATKVVLASVSSEEMPESALADLRKMVSDDKSEFLMAVADAREAQTEIAMKEAESKMRDTEYSMNRTETDRDFAMQKKEIDEKIAMLEKDVELAQGQFLAAQVSYGTVLRGLTEGLNIVAPRDGIVSVIMKKNGDFVEPGMAVASMNSGDASERFVRFHIPSNLPAPETGTMLTIIRPGFPTDTKQVKLVGIGTALDENGSYVADADFVDPTDWPVRASVRVMPPINSSLTVFIPLSAVWWDETGAANVWIVENEMLQARKIKTGRAQFDTIEVTEGLQQGDRYVSKPLPNMKEGMSAAGMSTGSSGGRTGTNMHGGMDMN